MTDSPPDRPAISAWEPLLAEVLQEAMHPAVTWADATFGELGGSSLQAYQLAELSEQRLGLVLDLTCLLSDMALGEVLDSAQLAWPVFAPPSGDRPLLPGQEQMLTAHLAGRDAMYRVMFSVVAPALDGARVVASLQALTARHESLRTRFVAEGDEFARRVLPRWQIPIRELELTPGPGRSAERMEALVRPAAEALLRPFEQPPWCAFIGRSAGADDVLTLLFHHVIVDGWSIGVILREFAEFYGHGAFAEPMAPAPDSSLSRHRDRADSGLLAEDLNRVAERLAGAPLSLRLPGAAGEESVLSAANGSQLTIALPPEVRDAVDAAARRVAVRRPVVLLAAWAFVLGRRAGVDDLVLAMPVSGRFRADQFDTVGMLTRRVPVRLRLDAGRTVDEYLRHAGGEYAAAVRDSEIPSQDLVLRLGARPARGSNALLQFAFAAHDELVPGGLDLAGMPAEVAEGYCGGSVCDASLYLQRWGDEPTLALEYSTAQISPQTAAALIGALFAALLEFGRMPAAPIAGLTGLSIAERAQVTTLAEYGPDRTDEPAGLWDRVVSAVGRSPDAIAVVDPAAGNTLTYRQLDHAVGQYTVALSRAGVAAGDRVIIQVDRSAAEIVAVLAVIRVGASYVAVPPEIAETQGDAVLRATGATAVVIPAGSRHDWPERVRAVAAWAPDAAQAGESGPVPDFDRRAADGSSCISFTSGTTGTPKAVEVPDRGVIRLATDTGLLRPADDDDPARPRTMLRLAPLASDGSALELFYPLLNGDRIAILPPGPTSPRAICDFLHQEGVTHLSLPAGVFRLLAEFEPASLSSLRQIVTGGDVISPDHVRTVLEACPGLWITNAYGSTENTTITTFHHVTSADAVGPSIPIGRPIAGTGVLVVDGSGRPAPPGADGELYATGLGLARRYAGDDERTAATFVTVPWLPGERAFATGDIVCWNDTGELLYRGRRDQQVKASATGRFAAETAAPGVPRPPLAASPALASPTLPGGDVVEEVAAVWRLLLGGDQFQYDEAFFDAGGDSLQLTEMRDALRELFPGVKITSVDIYRAPTVNQLAGLIKEGMRSASTRA